MTARGTASPVQDSTSRRPSPSSAAGLTYDCPGAREKAAYEAQARWLTQFDLTLQSTFGVDDLTLKLATACFHP
jgi:hypothetical protein